MRIAGHHAVRVLVSLTQCRIGDVDQGGRDPGREIPRTDAVDGGADVVAATRGMQAPAQLLPHQLDQMGLVVEIGLFACGIQLHRIRPVGLHLEQRLGQPDRRVVVQNALLVQHHQMRKVDLIQHLEIGEELAIQARKENILKHFRGKRLLQAAADFGFHFSPVGTRKL
ncbi:hypothetical protein G6F65_017189 [Rhizopus arrhizus]|nr:hypothetical protein G6F65_017189 [Rhizopus arrhizus]